MTKWFVLLAFITISVPLWGAEEKNCTPLDTRKGDDYVIGRFYTLHEGSDMLPLSWLQALPVWDLNGTRVANKDGQLKFLDPENVKRYGLLPYSGKASKSHVIGLTVGDNGMLGVNCAACHVNQIKIGNRTTDVLNGAPSLFDVEKFTKEMYYSLSRVCDLTKPVDCLKYFSEVEVPELLKTHPAEFFGRLEYLLTVASLSLTEHSYPFGPGRIDDFGGARDVLWGDPNPLSSTNKVPLVGPSSILDLWSFKDAKWIHWDLNMNSTFDRNLGQAITGGALYGGNHFKTPTVPLKDKPLTRVTVDACAIAELETIAETFTAPKWPMDIAPINPTDASNGEALFTKYCARCHTDSLPEEVRDYDKDNIGTDPFRARIYGLPMSDGTDFAQTANTDLPNLKDQIFQILKLSPDSIKYVDKKGKDARWRITNSYVARPLKGIWASAPYFHNGSVLTLTAVLDSTSRKPDRFQVGDLDYDPVNVGYVRKDCVPKDTEHYCFDPSLPGNSNQGHKFGDTLTATERKQVVEYLKTRN